MSHKLVLFLGLVLGFLSLATSVTTVPDPLRWLVGLTFIYLLSGYPLGLLLLPRAGSFPERILISSGLSLMLTYPAGFLNVLREGQSAEAIFGYHLTGSIFFLLVFYIASVALLCWRKREAFKEKIVLEFGPNWIVIIPLALSVFFNFYQLDRADLNGDEYDLGYQAYNLVDGVFAGRKAYTLSFSAHPPLSTYIQHYTMNVLDPSGLESLSDWMFRAGPALVGALTVIVIYTLVLEIVKNRFFALLAGVFLATNNYQLFLSRIYHREAFLTFFVVLLIYILIRYIGAKDKRFLLLAGLFSGASLLVKMAAIIPLTTTVIYLLNRFKRKSFVPVSYYLTVALLVFSPVLIYNLGAYLLTGHTDIFFSRIFGTPTHPGASKAVSDMLLNGRNIVLLLVDQYGLVLALVFGLSVISSFQRMYFLFLLFLLTTVIFFILNVVKVYYLSFLTPILIIFLTVCCKSFLEKNRIIGLFVVSLILLYSLSYSSKTFLDRSFVVSEKYTEIFPNPANNLSRHYSLTTRGFLEDRGWKRLQQELSLVYLPADCLDVDSNNHPLHLRRYLGVADRIKEYYLGKDYPRSYRLCSEGSFTGRRWLISVNDREVRLSDSTNL